MNDRELLEHAAKACGQSYLEWVPECYPGREGLLHGNQNGRLYVWNPLLDDGEALRLRAKLHLTIMDNGKRIGVACCHHIRIGIEEFIVDDPCATTRRAIVRAAAEIGKSMPKEGE